MKLYDKLAGGATGDEKKAIYGLIATTVAGEAATTLRASGAKGDGPAAYKALKDEYSGGRTMQAGNDFRRALSEGQGSASTQKYLLTKRSLFAAIEQVFEKDYEKLWNFAKASSTILNLNNETAKDYLFLELGGALAANQDFDYKKVEAVVQAYADSKVREGTGTKNVALSGVEADGGGNGKGKGGGKGKKKTMHRWLRQCTDVARGLPRLWSRL